MLLKRLLGFRCVASFRKQRALIATLARQISHFSPTPVELGERWWAKCLRLSVKFSLGPNLGYTCSFGAEPLLGVGDTTHFRARFQGRQFCRHEISVLGSYAYQSWIRKWPIICAPN